ncbi:hypothetical protein CARUB_v10024400mg [Capsella rubella]|uniref:Knottins-like domain-containing protein n=1 Tax=Capsella rubella TaxID=81985 RepID=R0HS77_9BRAS|nr:hypothetical protein CARUB_v10024400mg [Capsella rubella]
MAMATKSVSTLVIFLVLALAINVYAEMPKTEASKAACLREYVDASPFFCMDRIYPSLCYYKCRSDEGAKGGKCDDLTCYCDFCSKEPNFEQFLRTVV